MDLLLDSTLARATLARTPAMSAQGVQVLASACHDLSRILDPEVLATADIPPEAKAYLNLPDEHALHADLEWIAASGAQLLAATDPGFPAQLLQIRDAPPVLYV